jgi:cysteine dioxygenase
MPSVTEDYFDALPSSLQYARGVFSASTQPLQLAALESILKELRISEEEALKIARFDAASYFRLRLLKTDALEVLLLGWQPGQSSPLHNHRGSNCGVRVLSGRGFEISFEHSACGLLAPTEVNYFNAGDVAVSAPVDVHQVGNADETPLVTLHVYTPPLSHFDQYSEADTVLSAAPHRSRRVQAPRRFGLAQRAAADSN